MYGLIYFIIVRGKPFSMESQFDARLTQVLLLLFSVSLQIRFSGLLRFLRIQSLCAACLPVVGCTLTVVAAVLLIDTFLLMRSWKCCLV